MPPHERQVGFVFQDLALWPHLTVIDHVYLVGLGSSREASSNAWRSHARWRENRPSCCSMNRFRPWPATTKDSLYALLRQFSPLLAGPTIYVTHHVDDAVSLAKQVITLEAGTLAPAECPWE